LIFHFHREPQKNEVYLLLATSLEVVEAQRTAAQTRQLGWGARLAEVSTVCHHSQKSKKEEVLGSRKEYFSQKKIRGAILCLLMAVWRLFSVRRPMCFTTAKN
jgi:hypothetical protein